MNIFNLATQAASIKNWPLTRNNDGSIQLEIALQTGRKQVVQLHPSQDGDGDPVVFVWSKVGSLSTAQMEPWGLLRFNVQLIYGRVAVHGDDVIVAHALYDTDAQLAEVGKTIYWLAKAADDLEQGAYGTYQDNF